MKKNLITLFVVSAISALIIGCSPGEEGNTAGANTAPADLSLNAPAANTPPVNAPATTNPTAADPKK